MKLLPARPLAFCTVALLSAAFSAQAQLGFTAVGSYGSGIFDGSAAEIPAYDAATQRLFVTNAAAGTLDVLDLSEPATPTLIQQLALGGGGPNSVAVSNGRVAVAVEAATPTDAGTVQFFSAATLAPTGSALVGALPDQLTFTPDGARVLVANEGEASGGVDPLGSVSIIDVATLSVSTAGFTGFTDANTATTATAGNTPVNAVRRDPSRATLAQDVEPEYIAVSPDGRRAFVALQEANTVAVLNLETNAFDTLLPLGVKDHSVTGQGLDPSDRDDGVNIAPHPVFGLYMPDAIASYDAGGSTFFVTANEGDDRGEDERIGNLTLDPAAFPNADAIQQDANLGRLAVSTFDGDADGDGDFDALYAYGTRSFTIFDEAGQVVFDSGNAFETITADTAGVVFNGTNDENDSFDSRSDAKGPEPEGLALGEIDGRTYAFIGLERVGGVMIYDISDPEQATFDSYLNPRDFGIDDAALADAVAASAGTISDNPGALDLGPEGLLFIAATDNALNVPLLVVTNEVSGTTTVYAVPEPGTLAVLMAGVGAGWARRRRA